MLKQVRSLLGGFVASEDGVRKQAILPVAWVGAVMMTAAAVLSMPQAAQAGSCWTSVNCAGQNAYYCQSVCTGSGGCGGTGWSCSDFPGTCEKRCKCYYS